MQDQIGEAKYFLTFIDNRIHYVWVYPLKHKGEASDCFLEWKAMIENVSGHKFPY